MGAFREMAHEGRADPMPLVLVDHGEGHLGLAGLHDNIASPPPPAITGRPSSVHDRHQGHVVDEVDVEKERRSPAR